MSANGLPHGAPPDKVWQEIEGVFKDEGRPLFPREVVASVLGRVATDEQEVRLLLLSMVDHSVLHSNEDLRLVYSETAADSEASA